MEQADPAFPAGRPVRPGGHQEPLGDDHHPGPAPAGRPSRAEAGTRRRPHRHPAGIRPAAAAVRGPGEVVELSLGAGDTICFFAFELFFLVAFFLFLLFLPIIVFLFQLWWMLALKFCIPPSISFQALAQFVADGKDLPGDADAASRPTSTLSCRCPGPRTCWSPALFQAVPDRAERIRRPGRRRRPGEFGRAAEAAAGAEQAGRPAVPEARYAAVSRRRSRHPEEYIGSGIGDLGLTALRGAAAADWCGRAWAVTPVWRQPGKETS